MGKLLCAIIRLFGGDHDWRYNKEGFRAHCQRGCKDVRIDFARLADFQRAGGRDGNV